MGDAWSGEIDSILRAADKRDQEEAQEAALPEWVVWFCFGDLSFGDLNERTTVRANTARDAIDRVMDYSSFRNRENARFWVYPYEDEKFFQVSMKVTEV